VLVNEFAEEVEDKMISFLSFLERDAIFSQAARIDAKLLVFTLFLSIVNLFLFLFSI
jgi:hypothetical protein